MRIYKLIITFLLLVSAAAAQSQTIQKIRTGKHLLSLQWISWKDFGTIAISTPGRDGYRIAKGSQYSPDSTDYLKIDGKLKQVSSRELVFKGVILVKVATLNNGEECKRQGIYHFKASGMRKYYRLQEMDNCEGGNVLDYADIYF